MAGLFLLGLVEPPGGPGKDRRVDIAKGPLVGGNLAVGMLVPLSQQQIDLPLGKINIDQGQRDTVKS